MRYPKYPNDNGRRMPHQQAALFLDYENLYLSAGNRLRSRTQADDLIFELIDETRRFLIKEAEARAGLIYAFADFSALGQAGAYLPRLLTYRGVTPRFASTALQRNATEHHLCVETAEVLCTRSDIDVYVILTGDRHYLPLVHMLRRHGKEVFVVSLEKPTFEEQHLPLEEHVFMDAVYLLSESSLEHIAPGGTEEAGGEVVQERASREGVEYSVVEEPIALRTLEIIEEYFGQYDEVYLTPLLRKLSELLGNETYDPKTIINDLEAANAVWLEKRRGFPYDYTVLLVDGEHPDVAQVRADYDERTANYDEYGEEDGEEEDFYEDYPSESDDADDDTYTPVSVGESEYDEEDDEEDPDRF